VAVVQTLTASHLKNFLLQWGTGKNRMTNPTKKICCYKFKGF